MQQLFLSTVRIESYISEGMKVGTGFVFAHEPDYLPEGQAAFYLVTNKHIVEDSEGGWFYFIGSSGAGTPALGDDVEIEMPPRFEDAWHGHPNPEVDVAVLYLNDMLHHRVEPDGSTVGEITSAAPSAACTCQRQNE